MDVVRFGRGVRALRIRRRWRQADLAVAARVSRSKVARIEVGHVEGMPTRDLERVAQALGARVDLRLSWNGEALDRLLDGEHARLVDVVAATLRLAGWEVVLEATFWIRGERGSIDVLAWHPSARVVLIVEVKSVVPDQQSMLASLDRKVRLGAAIAHERGWNAAAVGKLLVVRDTRTARRRVAALAETYAIAFPARFAAIRRWIRQPNSSVPLAGLLFLPDSQGLSTRHRVPRRRDAA